jgi:apolipoprotein N-acyltransferase
MKILQNKILIKLFILGCGAISVFAFAPTNIWELMVLTLFCWIAISNSDNFKIMAINSYIFGFGYFFANLYWTFICLHEVIRLNVIISLALHILFALFLATYILLSSCLYKILKIKKLEYRIVNYTFLLPTCWVLGEILRGRLFSGFPWYNLSYTAMNIDLFTGFFPIGGDYLVSWLFLSVVGASFFVLKSIFIKNQQDWRRLYSVLFYIVMLLFFGYKLANIQYTVTESKTVKIALIQGNNAVTEKWNMQYLHNLLNKYANMISKAKDAEIIILPETAISVFPNQLPMYYLKDLQALAKNSKIIIGMPLPLDLNEITYSNAAILLNNFTYYTKQHLVPYGEYIPLQSVLGSLYNNIALPMVNFKADSSHKQALTVNNIKMSFNLCYENGFGTELIEQSKNSQIMVNLSDMVWYKNTWAKDHHLQMSIARTLENQRYWVQDTNSGITTIISPTGKIVASLPINTQNILFYSVPLIHGMTPYQKVGDLLIYWILLINLIFAIILLFAKNYSRA